MEKFIKRFREEQIAVLCETKAEADEFLNILTQEEDINWRTGDRPKDFNPYGFLESTCFEIREENTLMYCEVDYFINEEYEVVKYADIKGEI